MDLRALLLLEDFIISSKQMDSHSLEARDVASGESRVLVNRLLAIEFTINVD